jgi:hypothetical protein
MAFHDRDYEVYIILGSPEMPPLWRWDRWQTVADLLAPFAEVPRGKAALRGHRYVPNPKKPGFSKAEGLGRIGWDRRSHEKWTFNSPLTNGLSSTWQFGNMEAWAPSWNVCGRENLAPDFYFSMNNQTMLGIANKELAFNPVIVLAVSASLDGDYRFGIREAALSLSSFVDSKLFVSRKRPWGYSWGLELKAFTGAIQDLGTGGLFKLGDPHGRPLNADTFAEEWSQVLVPQYRSGRI